MEDEGGPHLIRVTPRRGALREALGQIKPKVNEAAFDWWSVVHFAVGVTLGTLLEPKTAAGLMIGFEVFEDLGSRLDLEPHAFWRESFRNRWVGDIVADLAGIGVGHLVKRD